MADRDPLAEAYHALGSILDDADQADSELKQLVPKLLQEEQTLKTLLEKVTAQGDETNIARVRMLLDQVQQAWITIQQQLGDDAAQDQPQPEDDDASGEATPGNSVPAGSASDDAESAGQGDRGAGDQEGPDDQRSSDTAGQDDEHGA